MSHNSRLGIKWEIIRLAIVHGIKKESYGNLKVCYFLLRNWFILSVRISSYGCLEN